MGHAAKTNNTSVLHPRYRPFYDAGKEGSYYACKLSTSEVEAWSQGYLERIEKTSVVFIYPVLETLRKTKLTVRQKVQILNVLLTRHIATEKPKVDDGKKWLIFPPTTVIGDDGLKSLPRSVDFATDDAFSRFMVLVGENIRVDEPYLEIKDTTSTQRLVYMYFQGGHYIKLEK